MGEFNEMKSGINDVYARYLKKDRGIEYVFARLWEEYDDDNPDEEMVIYNLIIANKNIFEESITKNNWNCINRAITNYEENHTKIKMFFSDKDCSDIEQMYNQIMCMKAVKDNHIPNFGGE